MLLYISCDNGAAGLLPLKLNGIATIAPDLTFDGGGSGPNLTVALKGKFDNTTNTATGTLQIHLIYQGASCDTGAVTWGATRQ